MKLAFVVQRYGAGVAGGSEMHCRQLAERLSAHHDVTVLTTCARDYVTWQNAFPAGESLEGRVRVHRFPVAHPRNLKAFAGDADDTRLCHTRFSRSGYGIMRSKHCIG